MHVQLKHQACSSIAVVRLAPRESLLAEPFALVASSPSARLLQRPWFQRQVRIIAGDAGADVVLAPTHPANLIVVDVERGGLAVQTEAFIAGEAGVTLGREASLPGRRHIHGTGRVIVSCYGAFETRDLSPRASLVIDPSYLVAYDTSLHVQPLARRGWRSAFFGGGRDYIRVTGPGRLLMQTSHVREQVPNTHAALPI